jgi:hypothetical protein
VPDTRYQNPVAAPAQPQMATDPATQAALDAYGVTGGGGGNYPRSWLTPGSSYSSDVSNPTYWNAAGKPFQQGTDKESYWYNKPDETWYTGDLNKNVKPTWQLPWQQNTGTGNGWTNADETYFNAEGGQYTANDQTSYWYNPQDAAWYKGDKTTKQVTRVDAPPWLQTTTKP